MNVRYRWLRLDPLGRPGLVKITAAMESKPYARKGVSGYNLTSVRTDWIEGTFTERLEYTEKLPDPLGGEVSVQRVEFRQTDFRIAVAYPQLEFKNPARNVRPITNLIGEALDFQVAIAPIAVSPLEWVKQISQMGEPVQILGIRSGKFPLSNEVQASVIVAGTSDVRTSLPSLLGKRTIEIDSAVCGWGNAANEWRIELRSAGSANVLNSPVANPAQILRKALSNV